MLAFLDRLHYSFWRVDVRETMFARENRRHAQPVDGTQVGQAYSRFHQSAKIFRENLGWLNWVWACSGSAKWVSATSRIYAEWCRRRAWWPWLMSQPQGPSW